jgi:hypothetical protein
MEKMRSLWKIINNTGMNDHAVGMFYIVRTYNTKMNNHAVGMFLYCQNIEYRNEWSCCTYVSILSENRIQK